MPSSEFYRFEQDVLPRLDFAFQPILNIHTGACVGLEALLRGTAELGFGSIQEFFDEAHDRGFLLPTEMFLRERAVAKFRQWPHARQRRLFFNMDNRILKIPGDHARATITLLEVAGIDPGDFCLEISERHQIDEGEESRSYLSECRNARIRIAIDDFGSGYACFRMLYQLEPDYIKIDGFFVSDIFRDPRKKLFISKLIGLAHTLGILVVAEGIETPEAFMVCREIGCDLFQGYLAQKPTTVLAELKPQYPDIAALVHEDRRKPVNDQDVLRRQMVYIEPISINADSVSKALGVFRKNKTNTFFPVIDDRGEPLGVIREQELKNYIYSMYGWQLLANMGIKKIFKEFVTKCPAVEITTPVEAITDLFTLDESGHAEGVLVTENGKYVGFLNAMSLLKVLSEKNIIIARDQSPLTGLPGNNLINDCVGRVLQDGQKDCFIVYFDFDSFKPFNDKYGFRQGDRAILLFADILRKNLFPDAAEFIGHIGGDDFVCVFQAGEENLPAIQAWVQFIQEKFKDDVIHLYDQESRRAGLITGVERTGMVRRYELMTVSAAVLHIRAAGGVLTPETAIERLAALKQQIKTEGSRFLLSSV